MNYYFENTLYKRNGAAQRGGEGLWEKKKIVFRRAK